MGIPLRTICHRGNKLVNQFSKITPLSTGWHYNGFSVSCKTQVGDEDQKKRWRRKTTKEKRYLREMRLMAREMEKAVKQNNAVAIHDDYFEAEEDVPVSQKERQVGIKSALKDRHKRPVSDLSWSDNRSCHICVSYCSWQFLGMLPGTPSQANIFDCQDPRAALATLESPAHVTSIAYNRRMANMIGGGCNNGQVTAR